MKLVQIQHITHELLEEKKEKKRNRGWAETPGLSLSLCNLLRKGQRPCSVWVGAPPCGSGCVLLPDPQKGARPASSPPVSRGTLCLLVHAMIKPDPGELQRSHHCPRTRAGRRGCNYRFRGNHGYEEHRFLRLLSRLCRASPPLPPARPQRPAL